MALLSTVIGAGLHSARPAPGNAGYLYFETDTGILVRDSGAAWVQVAAAVTPATIPAVSAYNSVNQTLSAGVETALALDSTKYDEGTATPQHSTSSNNSRLTCEAAGVYIITGSVDFSAAGSDLRYIFIRKNGSVRLGTQSQAGQRDLCVSRQDALVVGDYVELVAYMAGGGSVAADGGNQSPAFQMAKIG